MNELYQGDLKTTRIPIALKELESIKQGLAKFPPDKMIWDIETYLLNHHGEQI